MKKLLLISFFFFSYFFSAQNNSSVLPQKKQHFIIHSLNNGVPDEIQNAISNAQLDSLRYVDHRRIIPIEGGQYSVELFSANELLKNYGRQLHPLNKNYDSDKRKFLIQVAKGNLRIILQ